MNAVVLADSENQFNSYISFRLLIETLKKMIAEGNPGSQKLYGDLVRKAEATPELLAPTADLSLLEPHTELVEMLLATIFPPTNADSDHLYAVALPFRYEILYASPLFKQLFMRTGSNLVQVPANLIGESLNEDKLRFAYHQILKKLVDYDASTYLTTVYPYIDPESGLTKYLQLNIDERFVEVNPAEKLDQLPANLVCKKTNRVMQLKELQQHLPLEKFRFEGLAIIRINDVTEQEVISRIKSSLLDINAFSDASVYTQLQQHIQSLLGLQDVKVGITPFFKVNDHYIYSELHSSNSLLYKKFKAVAEKDKANDCCANLFHDTDFSVAFETITDEDVKQLEYLDVYRQQEVKSLILCPLKSKGELIGLLEIASAIPHRLKNYHIDKIQSALPLFTLALEKSVDILDTQVDKIIKEKFTAVQPAVEWKFTEIALNYIVARQQNENVKIERIVFEDVYPVFGAIDIRNSSTERSHAIQLDIIEQLDMARAIVKKAQSATFFPLLQEIEFKIDKYIASASDVLLSDEEILIHDFLQDKVVGLFNHLQVSVPGLKTIIDDYYAALDPQLKMIYRHRKEYEESIATINDTVAKFIDKEQIPAQQVYPHYFERYVTDGVEFNAYIGQCIAPRKPFDDLYLRNLKMWQLTVLAKAARLTNTLQDKLSHPLLTTQLILAHSIPISISFRTAERKFDVDGAYNIRYEIIKKRIDKVHIKDTNERLTQPGKIAIVYSQAKEAVEYKEYIEFLQNQQLLDPGIEEWELEELQGVVGLKALRVTVNYSTVAKTEKKMQLSETTTDKLLGK
jgi:GAF domain-containing protein